MSRPAVSIPLSVPHFTGNEWRYVKNCLDTGWVSAVGKYVEIFENNIRKYTGAKYAIACTNGTAGLQVSLRLAGVKYNDEVIVPTLTFIAPVNTVRYMNAEPVFMDCDDYMNMDPQKLDDFCRKECKMTALGLKNKRSGRIIRAMLPVHVFGNPCDLGSMMQIAGKFRLRIVEDAAESLGSHYTAGPCKGRFTGTLGDFGVYSFNGNKIITTGGGGMIVTNNKGLSEKARYLTTQAKDNPLKYIHNEIGYNYRLTNIQAAVGTAQLEQLGDFIRIKKCNYRLYRDAFADTPGIELMSAPKGTSSNHWFYPLRINRKKIGMSRERLACELARCGIQTQPVWHLNHMQKTYRNNQAYKIEKAVLFHEQVLNIPCSTNLAEKDIFKVAGTIQKLVGKKRVKQ